MHSGVQAPEARQRAKRGAQAVPVASYARERVEWLVARRVPLGAVSVLVGDPGLGKSLWTCGVAGEVSRAGSAVLLATAEDSISATVRPRLEAADADLDRVQIVRLLHEGVEEGLRLPDDVGELSRLVSENGARLVVVDPLMAHLPENVNSWRDQSIRRALAPLHYLAEANGCAVIVVAHLNKAAGTDALYRIGGSIGIGGAARSVLLFARDPDDPEGEQGSQRVLAHVKCNVAEKAPALAYRVERTLLSGDQQIQTAKLSALGEVETSSADLLGRQDQDEAPARSEAEEFLSTVLSDGAVPAKQVMDQAREAVIAEKTLRRAKAKLGVKAVQLHGRPHGGWAWQLPDDEGGHLTPEDGHLTAVEPEPDISGGGRLMGEGDHLRVRRSGGHVERDGHVMSPPRRSQVWAYPDAPDDRLRVVAVNGDQVRVRTESPSGHSGRLLEIPLDAFGVRLRRYA